MKKTMFLTAICSCLLAGAAFGGQAVSVQSSQQTFTSADLDLTQNLVVNGVAVYEYNSASNTGVFTGGINFDSIDFTVSDTALTGTSSATNIIYATLNNCSWGIQSAEGGTISGVWNQNSGVPTRWTGAANYNVVHDTYASYVEGGVLTLNADLKDTTTINAKKDGSGDLSLYNVGNLKAGGQPTKLTINTNYVQSVDSFNLTADVISSLTAPLGDGTTKEYTSVARNGIATEQVQATLIGGGDSNARLEVKGANTEKMSANGGDIIIGTKGQLYFTGGTLTNDVYIGGSNMYTETSSSYHYDGDLRMQGDSDLELAGNLILTGDATIVGDGNAVISGEIQGEGKDLHINVGASGVNKTMTISGGGEVKDLTVGNATQRIGLKFTGEDFSMHSLTTSGAVIIDGVTLTIEALTLNAGNTIDVTENGGTLATSAMTVNGDATINADLVTAANSTLTFEGGAVTLNGELTLGSGTTVSLGSAYLETLQSDGQVLLFTGVTNLIDSSILESIVVTGDFMPGHLLSVDAGDGTYNIYATPEPATATLSLLALAGLAARRRRH